MDQYRFRQQTSVPFQANSRQSVRLARGFKLHHLGLRLQGRYAVLVGNDTSANTQRGDFWGCIQRVEVIANSSDVIRTFTGQELFWYNYLMFGKNPRINPAIASGVADPAATDVHLVIPFWQPRSVRPKDFLLDTRRLSDLTLEVTWGNFTSINSQATSFLVNPTLDVFSFESFDPQTPIDQEEIFATVRNTRIQTSFVGAGTDVRLDIPTGPLYRYLMLNTTTSADVDSANIVNRVRLQSGTTVYQDYPWQTMTQLNNLTLPLEDGFERSGGSGQGAYLQPLKSANSVRDAWQLLDLAPDGKWLNGVDSLNLGELFLRLDVTGAGKLNVFPISAAFPGRG
jgi:hypothetical protein